MTHGTIRVDYTSAAGRTSAARLYESGCLRLRHVYGTRCEGLIVNTGGGIVAGDALSCSLRLEADATVAISSVAAEKIYRSDERHAEIAVRLDLGQGSCLHWLPQETILFDGGRLRRRFDIDMAADARLVVAEIMVFGRLAHGERALAGSFRDSWRLRRDGRLVFADEARLDGEIGAALDRKAVADGGRASAFLLVASRDAERDLQRIREAAARSGTEESEMRVDVGASLRDGVAIARCVARSPERLRSVVLNMLGAIDGVRVPRVWL